MTYSFVELLIFFWLTQIDIYCLEFMSHHITEYCIWIQTPKEINHQTKTSIFTCFFSLNKNKHFHLFLWYKYKNSLWIIFFFQFHEHIFRSSSLQMLFKIGALKDFAIFWIKKRLQHRCFSVNFNFLTTAFL